MNHSFYFKLAATNIKKNSKTYFPYILTCIGTIIVFYIMHALSINPQVGDGSLALMLSFGTQVIAIFSIIFLFYTNSFLIKRRKKELGLYNILGMEKKHIAKVLSLETIYVAVFSLIVGLLSGILTSKLMFLLLLKITHFSAQMDFYFSISSVTAVLVVFGFIFAVTLLNNLHQIHLANPIELLNGSQTGEKEPKTKWLLAVIGFICLGIGYYIALTTESPLAAMGLFFIAVILVIIGTYSLFIAGSVAFLKKLRNNKYFYYKPKNFLNISGLIYRMKQNAVGLANICILSTGVLIVLSTTVSMYIGQKDVIRTRYPQNVMISTMDTTPYSEKAPDNIKYIVDTKLQEYKFTADNMIDYTYLTIAAEESGYVFSVDSSNIVDSSSNVRHLYFILLDDYNRIEHKSQTLDENEVLLFTGNQKYGYESLEIINKKYSIKEKLDSINIPTTNTNSAITCYYIIVKDIAVLNTFDKELPTQSLHYYIGFDIDGSEEDIISLTNSIDISLTENYPSLVESAAKAKSTFYALYGGLLFLGIFIGALFIMATVLIIYYKQISEGYDDKERFTIMKQVGMSTDEVKKTIHSQVLMVFFIPLIAAVIHIAVAFQIMTKLLAVLYLTNIFLFALCTLGTIAIFTIFYAIVYSLTARVYYKIVN